MPITSLWEPQDKGTTMPLLLSPSPLPVGLLQRYEWWHRRVPRPQLSLLGAVLLGNPPPLWEPPPWHNVLHWGVGLVSQHPPFLPWLGWWGLRPRWMWGRGWVRNVPPPPPPGSCRCGGGCPQMPKFYHYHPPLWGMSCKGCVPNFTRGPPLGENVCCPLGVKAKYLHTGARPV